MALRSFRVSQKAHQEMALHILLFLPSTSSVVASAVDEHLEILVHCSLLVVALASHGIISCRTLVFGRVETPTHFKG